MTRTLITIVLVVFAIGAAPMPTNPFDGTDKSVEEEGTLNIVHSGGNETITITDDAQNEWQVDVVNGSASWQVPEGVEGNLFLEDRFQNGWAVNVIET